MAYNPQVPPQAPEELLPYLDEEFHRVALALNSSVDLVHLKVWYEQPPRPRPGMIVYADGTIWNPGSGEGIYRYNLSNTWSFVG